MDDGYQNEEYYNDNVSEKITHTEEVHSEFEPTKADSMILDQGYENAEPEYEYIGFSGIQMRRLPDNRGKAEPALYTFEDDKRGPFIRKPVSIFSLLLLCSLIMVKAAFVMTSVRCFSVCPDEWVAFQEKCYYFPIKTGNWGEVRSFCRWLGADLMIIDNKMEQDFLIYKMDSTKNLWIGLRYAEGVPGWQWVDGTELTFENWETPDNIQLTDKYNYKTHCVLTSDEASKGKWNNIPCDKLHLSVCERDKEVTCVLWSPLSPH
nr:asialoglycoprotein receptor 2-like [Podarcis muralis]